MKRETTFIKSTLVLTIGTVIPRLATFVTLPLYTAYLTKAEYGTYDLILTLCSLFIPIATLMLPSSAFRFLIEYRDDLQEQKKIITNIFFANMLTSAFSLFILFLCLSSIDISVRFLICLYFMFNILTSMCQQISRGLLQNRMYTISAILMSIINLILVVVALYVLNSGIEGVLICLVISTLVSGIYIILHAKLFIYIKFSLIEKKCLKELISYSWPLIPNNISSWIMTMSDRVIVLHFLGIEQNALLAVAHKIPQILMLVQNAFTMSWQESASISSTDLDVSDYYSKMFKSLYYIMTGSTMVLVAATSLMFKILIRGDYDEAFYQVPIFFIAFFLSCVSTYLGGIYVAHKKTRNVGVTTVLAAVINVVINLALINSIGLYAASISTLCGYIFIDIYRYINIQHIVKIKFNILQIIIGLSGIGFSTFLCYLRRPVIDIINITISLVVCCILNRNVLSSLLTMLKMRKNRVDI